MLGCCWRPSFWRFLLFWGLFYITEVEVVGKHPLYRGRRWRIWRCRASSPTILVLLSTFQGHIALDDIPFMESVDVEYLGPERSVRLHVNEKQPIGYVRQDGYGLLF